ncbi:hypothetical protein NQ176_g2559 [Zarea fungicola]|uniref:Uncharacterized protein n=1 Tax=Zarea fungicola TaxID=93591 RepID=A0ACC1NMM0_9HYPO|nr:hypothetical protein NQ176_g2559 [Lecanicillium fungicola]
MGNHTSAEYRESECEVTLSDSLGSIRGIQYDGQSCRYANIPYAKPPIGSLRWRKPQPLEPGFSYTLPDGGAFDGTKLGNVCPQPTYTSIGAKKHSFSEDCLRLNIWTPSQTPETGKRWPVVVWFHGGWFQVGDPSHDMSMNPIEFVRETGAIFVAVGYRLNMFGFLSGTALLEESNGTGAGNFGLWDQRLGMDWVYGKISAFGGDPENIILAGRSAGAYAVQAQALYDFRGSMDSGERNHFRRLIMYSNAIPAQPKTVAECDEQFQEICDFFKIPQAASSSEKLRLLRAIPAEDLTAAIMSLRNHTFRPVTDNDFFHDGMVEYFKSGTFAAEFKKRGLRLLVSEMLNEESLYGATNGPEASKESLKMQVSNYYSKACTTRLLEYYPAPHSDDKKDWASVFGRIISDGQVRVPSRFIVDNLTEHGVDIKDIWRYLVAYRLSFITDKVAPASFGVTHSMDKPLWK